MKNKIIDRLNHALGLHGFDYDEFDERVIIGTNMCCQLGFEKELLQRGVMADISLEDDKVDAPKGVAYYLWLPTVDHQPPSPDKLALGVQTLTFFKEKDIKVYIHCKNGHGRASTLFAAYLISHGMGFEEAIAAIKAKRPGAHLSETQVQALKEYMHGLGLKK